MKVVEVVGRKISRAKWDPKHGVGKHEIPADAVTIDLRTRENRLSFWRCGTMRELRIRDLVLALAAAADRIDKMDCIWFEQSQLTDVGLEVVETDGETAVESLRKDHVDVSALDLHRLGKVAEIVTTALENNRFRRFTRKEVIATLTDAVERKLVQRKDLPERVQQQLAGA